MREKSTLGKEILAKLAALFKNRQNSSKFLPAKLEFFSNPPKLIPAKFPWLSYKFFCKLR